jgi:uracil-DNA glycosylase
MADEAQRLIRQLETHLKWLERQGVTGLPVGQPKTAAPCAEPAAAGKLTLEVIREEVGDCTRCKLHPTRKTIVFGVGNSNANLMFIGEAPGFDEDQQGEPFVGKAGQLLTKMIIAMGLAREDVYIANILMCRPPQNRNPEPDEIAACEPFLRKKIDAIAPRILVALGKFAAQTLLRTDASISSLRGHWKTYQGIQLMPTFHPAFLLRSPDKKREAWSDLQLVMAEMRRLGLYPEGK